VRACPEQKFSLEPDHLMAATKREDLVVYEGQTSVPYDAKAIRQEIHKLFGRSLKLRQVSAGGDNSNEMELNAADNINFDMSRYGIEWVASPRHSDGLVITGPITNNMARALQICYDSVPDPKIVILVGPEAISGGLYKGSPDLDRTFLDLVHVDLYIPGNPMHPLTFLNGLLRLLNIIPA
jgi:Ni,Fe-hydrogenase III small subunit